MASELDLVQGTLDLLVLRALAWGPQHGYAVARWIHTSSGDALAVEDRALYVSLHRLEARGHVESEWGVSENNRKAKFYRLARSAGRPRRGRGAGFAAIRSLAARSAFADAEHVAHACSCAGRDSGSGLARNSDRA